MKNNNYNVYIHLNKNNNKIYVGITKQVPKKRWRNGNGYKNNILFYRAIQKYGWDNFEHKILYEHLTKEEAEQKEIELIAQYKSNQKEFGYNIENGGNHQGNVSEETKRKIGIAHKGKKLSNDARKKISDSNKIRFSKKENHPMYGKHHSQDTINKIIESKKHTKRIVQFDLKGNFIRVWDNSMQIERELGINHCHIGSVARGNQLSSHNFIWKYEKDLTTNKINKYNNKTIKRVNQYDLDGNFITTFDKMTDIKDKYGYNLSHISQCCNGIKNKAYNYCWRFAND